MTTNDDTNGLPALPRELTDRMFALLFGDPGLRERAFAELLAAHAGHAEALRAHWQHHLRLEREVAPSEVGDDGAFPGYRLLSVLGEGGMGTVYRAEQREPHRVVALKVIKPGMDSKTVLARFEQERAALAAMDHDAIAKVFDCGTSTRGQPYFAMELVDGMPIQRYCDEHRLSLRARLELFAQVCQGVQHAHQKGVIHRDLKPGNVLVTAQQGRHAVKIIDFGVARAIDRRLSVGSFFTEQGVIVGTPEYMSPEQASGDLRRVDTRTDIYSLGVILYELLVGELPFPAAELRAAGIAEIERRLRDDEPPKPSTRLSALGRLGTTCASLRQVSVEGLRRELAGDLDWVVLKAMAKEPERRYASATALAEDLQRYLVHEPLQAGPPSAGYRLRKLVRRHRNGVVLGTAVFVTALVGAVVALQFALREQAKNREFDLLSGVVMHESALDAAKALHPPWPRQIAAMEKWLHEDADRLLAMQPTIEQAVRELEARALPAADSAALPRTFRFGSEAERFLHQNLSALLPKLAALATRDRVQVAQQLSWARQIQALSLAHPLARHTWAEVRDALAKADGVVASNLYAGQPIEIRDQDVIGLVPIGMNPVTKLWEFYELRSAWDGKRDPQTIAIPQHDRRGRIAVGEDTGIVFVLLPGGKFLMGAQKEDPAGANHDENALGMEDPVCEVSLAPFFLSRYEMTQGQWARLWTGAEEWRLPSQCRAGIKDAAGDTFTLANPVERVDWDMCDSLLTRCGLTLPTEAQWEYGARAGTSTPWHCAREELPRFGNLLDATAKRTSPNWPGSFESWSDGYTRTAPVGSFEPNGFGLHDVYGNVWEWSLDRYAPYTMPVRSGDGLRESTAPATARVDRGGAYGCGSAYARSAVRRDRVSTYRDSGSGLRPARALHLPE